MCGYALGPAAVIRCCRVAGLKAYALMPVADSLKCLRLQEHRTGLKCSKNTKQNKALQTLKTAVCRWFQLLQNKLLHLSARSLEQVGCWLADGGGLARRL